MFKYIVTDHGAILQGLIAFVLTFSIFLTIMLRAWRMRRTESDHLSNLPLSDDTETTHTTKS